MTRRRKSKAVVKRLSTAAAVVAVASLAWSGSASAETDPAAIAEGLRSDPVYVDRDAHRTLSSAEAGRVRLRIVERNIGRIKVAVLPEEAAEGAGGIAPLANSIDRELAAPGTLIVAAGKGLYAVTSYPQVDQAVRALRQAVSENAGAGLSAQLLDAVNRIARIDPGAAGDLALPRTATPTSPGDDFLHELLELLRLVAFGVVALMALPVLFLAGRGLWRWNRRRQDASDRLLAARRRARESLIALGDNIRALDLDVSMPDADRGALADYEQALARYEEASRTLDGADTPRRVELATLALDEGRMRIETAKARLGDHGAHTVGR